MNLEKNLAEATGTISHRFLMLVQALSGIRGLTALTIENSDEQELLEDVLKVITQNLDVECCSIFLRDISDELYCAVGQDWKYTRKPGSTEKKHTHRFKIGQGIIGHAAESGKLYHCRNCRTDKNYLSIIHPEVDHNVGSLICMPIMMGEEVLGVLNLSHPEPDFFHPWQEHVISIHASILAQMLYSHRLMKDMATQVKNRTRQLQVSLAETESLKAKYEALSVIDDLTQIYNRRYFFSEVPSAVARALRYRQPISLMFIDLDHFKSINDNYGHEVGDRVLRDVASILSKQSRKGDILARMGGEEFALAVPNTEHEGILLLAKRIRDSVSQVSWEHENDSFSITLSIGISELKQPKESPQKIMRHVNEIVRILVREADDALYHSKDDGRNTLTFYKNLQRNRL